MGEVDEAYAVLRHFIGSMHHWEVTYWQAIAEKGRGTVSTDMKRDLDVIFETYCTHKKRETGRQVALHCGHPPEYRVDEEFVAGTWAKNAVVIETLQHHILASRFGSTMRLHGSEWKVDRKEQYDSFDEKWVNHEL